MSKNFMITASLILCSLTPSFSFAEDTPKREKLVKHFQAVSVTIKSESRYSRGSGSGVVVTRYLKDALGKSHRVTFVWTAGHVIDNLRKVRNVIDPRTGTSRKIIEFGRPQIVKELIDTRTGQKTGEIKLDTVVLSYSDADTGEDLALLMVMDKEYIKFSESAKFYLGRKIPSIGTPICHVGSRWGQFGAGSFSSGEISSVGRVFKDVSYKVFDQTSVAASPGSSGGGMFLKWGEKNAGACVGLIVRGGEDSFNFIVPVRRMKAWAKKMGLLFALDPEAKMPLLEDLKKISIDDGWAARKRIRNKKAYKNPAPAKLDIRILKSGKILRGSLFRSSVTNKLVIKEIKKEVKVKK